MLLYGPPGTGKTMLAKATAGESSASFISCTSADFNEIYLGMGAKRVRELFQKARRYAPSIIFIDEIDGMGNREAFKFMQGLASDNERNNTINQLLTEMDGFREHDNIVVIAATNRINVVDEALVRSGRFDTKIQILLPTEEEREGIINIHLKKKTHEVTQDIVNKIAQEAVGLSGADLETMVNESAYCCISHQGSKISNNDLLEAWKKLSKELKVMN